MTPHLAGGWLVLPYDGPELAPVEIGIDGEWKSAYRDFENRQRVVKIRMAEPPPGPVNVQLRTGATVTGLGRIRLG